MTYNYNKDSKVVTRVVEYNTTNSFYYDNTYQCMSEDRFDIFVISDFNSVLHNLEGIVEYDIRKKIIVPLCSGLLKSQGLESKMNTPLNRILKNYSTGYVVKDLSKGNECILYYDINRHVLFKVDVKFKDKWTELLSKKYKKVETCKDIVVILYSDNEINKCKLKGQIWNMLNIFGDIKGMINKTKELVIGTKNVFSDPYTPSTLMDALSLIADINNPSFWSPGRLLTFITRLYSVVDRCKIAWKKIKGQFLEINSFDMAILAVSTLGLPVCVTKGLKELSMLTSKKLLDTPNTMLKMIEKFFEIISQSLDWIYDKLPEDVQFTKPIISIPFTIFRQYKIVNQVEAMVKANVENKRILTDIGFRKNVLDLEAEIKLFPYVLQRLNNPNDKVVSYVYEQFKHLVKDVSNYESSVRIEPVCLIFEGAPAMGKTVMMSKLLESLRSDNATIYPGYFATADEKQWFDDYQNQTFFTADDVGAKGKSQWSHLINIISSQKMPLPCAEAHLKNTKFFTSTAVLLTTNGFMDLRGFTNTDGITDTGALFRRGKVIKFHTKFIDGKMTGLLQYNAYDPITNVWGTELPACCIVDSSTFVFSETNTMSEAVMWIRAILEDIMADKERIYNATKSEPVTGDRYRQWRKIQLEKEQAMFGQSLGGLMFQSAFVLHYMQTIAVNIMENLKDIFAKFISTDTVVFICLLTIFSTLVSYTLYKIFFDGEEILDNKQLETAYNVNVVASWRKSMTDKFREQTKELLSTPTTTQALCKAMRVLEIMTTSDVGLARTGLVQAVVSGSKIMTVRHAFDIPNLQRIKINVYRDWDSLANDCKEVNNVDVKVVFEDKIHDIIILQLPHVIPLYPNINKLLTLSNENQVNKQLYFVNCDGAENLLGSFYRNESSTTYETRFYNVTIGPEKGLFYPITADGLCGSIIYDGRGGLIGLHVAGNESQGFAVCFSENLKKDVLLHMNENRGTLQSKQKVLPSGVELYNDIIPIKHPLMDTSLEPTPLFDIDKLLVENGYIVGSKAPPVFVDDTGKTKIHEIAKKSFKVVPLIEDNRELEYAKMCISSFFHTFSDLTDYEVIKGNEILTGMNKDSVNGIGYEADKSLYIDFSKGEITPLFEEKLESFIRKANGDQLDFEDVMFSETFKDELRPLHKTNKPRSFRVAPLHHTFLCKKYMGSLLQHIKGNMWSNQIAIGMNPYKDWDRLYTKMKGKPHHFDGDVGNWDGGCNPQIQTAVKEIVLSYYTGENKQVLERLLESMIRTPVLVKDSVLVTTHSMPSGCWVTALFNSLYNRFITALVIAREMLKKGLEPKLMHFENVVDFVMGDDKICAVGKDMGEFFNALTVKSYFNSLGMDYTDGEKGEITQKYKDLSDCVFLKRGFRLHKQLNKIVGPLSLDTIANTLRYTDVRKDFNVVMDGKMTAVQFELYLYEDELLRRLIIDEAEKKKISFKLFSNKIIEKSMHEDDTYIYIQRLQNKQYQY